jgi:hypothetical protein
MTEHRSAATPLGPPAYCVATATPISETAHVRLQEVPGERALGATASGVLAKVRKRARKYGVAAPLRTAGADEECEREVNREAEAEREREKQVELPRAKALPEVDSDVAILPSAQTTSGMLSVSTRPSGDWAGLLQLPSAAVAPLHGLQVRCLSVRLLTLDETCELRARVCSVWSQTRSCNICAHAQRTSFIPCSLQVRRLQDAVALLDEHAAGTASTEMPEKTAAECLAWPSTMYATENFCTTVSHEDDWSAEFVRRPSFLVLCKDSSVLLVSERTFCSRRTTMWCAAALSAHATSPSPT